MRLYSVHKTMVSIGGVITLRSIRGRWVVVYWASF